MPLPSPLPPLETVPADASLKSPRPRLDLFSVFVYVVVAGAVASQFVLITWLARR